MSCIQNIQKPVEHNNKKSNLKMDKRFEDTLHDRRQEGPINARRDAQHGH